MEVPPPRPVPPSRTKPASSVSSTTSKSAEEEKADKFMELHAEAYKITSEAMKLDEERKRDQAFNSYHKSLELIDKAVSLGHSGGFPEDKVSRVDELVYKMRMTRKEILERVSDIQHVASGSEYLQGPSTSQPATSVADGPGTAHRRPPTYESLSSDDGQHQATSESQARTGLRTGAYSTLNASLDEIATEEEFLRNPLPLNAQEVFQIEGNVQIYFISKDDTVSAPSYPSFLRVVIINQDESLPITSQPQPPAFIQVGNWTYPLIPGQSPILHATDGSYIFPDLKDDAAGASVGLILPADLPKEEIQALEEILQQIIGQAAFLTPQEPRPAEALPKSIPSTPTLPPPTTIGSQIAAGLIQGADKLAHGLVYGAEKTSQFMDKGAAYLVTKIEPAQEKPNIHPGVKSGIKTARSVTSKAVKVSAYLVNQLSKGTMKLGHHVAPYVHRTATQIYAKALNTNEAEASGKLDQVIEVAGGAVIGFGTVFVSLEHAATVLAKSLRNNTVNVVQHRYGHEAGSFCEDTTSTIGNSVLTGYNVKGLAPKALAKRVAKDTGKALVTSPQEKPNNQ